MANQRTEACSGASACWLVLPASGRTAGPATTASAGGRHVVLRDEDDAVAEATAGEVPLSVGDVLQRHLLDG